MLGGGSALKLMQAQFQYRDEDYNTLFNEFKAIMEKNHELKNDLYACQYSLLFYLKEPAEQLAVVSCSFSINFKL